MAPWGRRCAMPPSSGTAASAGRTPRAQQRPCTPPTCRPARRRAAPTGAGCTSGAGHGAGAGWGCCCWALAARHACRTAACLALHPCQPFWPCLSANPPSVDAAGRYPPTRCPGAAARHTGESTLRRCPACRCSRYELGCQLERAAWAPNPSTLADGGSILSCRTEQCPNIPLLPPSPSAFWPHPRPMRVQRLKADFERKRGSGVPVSIMVHEPYLADRWGWRAAWLFVWEDCRLKLQRARHSLPLPADCVGMSLHSRLTSVPASDRAPAAAAPRASRSSTSCTGRWLSRAPGRSPIGSMSTGGRRRPAHGCGAGGRGEGRVPVGEPGCSACAHAGGCSPAISAGMSCTFAMPITRLPPAHLPPAAVGGSAVPLCVRQGIRAAVAALHPPECTNVKEHALQDG